MNTQKLLAGTLLAGIGIITGEATLIATAGAVGANWLSGGLGGVWATLRDRPADPPLARAYAAAIRQTVQDLEAEYRRTVDPRATGRAFKLVAGCANTVAEAEFPSDIVDADTAQRALEGALAALLHGHDERQAAFLRRRLLPACAAALQQQLVQDEKAWRAFHGLVLQGLAANSATLLGRLERFAETLAAWSSLENSLTQLQRIEVQLAELARQAAAAPAVSRPLFDNRGLRVGGGVYQATGNQYNYSAHATGSGTASVINYLGTPPPAGVSPAAPAPAVTPILFLAANPLNLPRLRLEQEAREVSEALRRARFGAQFRLAQQWAVRSEDLLDALLRERPSIIHFAGHGSQDGALYLEDAQGRSVPLAPAALAALSGATTSARCVVLNACWTDTLAQALLQSVACVVGMSNAVADETAVSFATGFYRALADGESVATAVAAGQAEALAVTGEKTAVQLRAATGVEPDLMRFHTDT